MGKWQCASMNSLVVYTKLFHSAMLDGYHLLTLTHRHAPVTHIGHAIVLQDFEPSLLRLKAELGWEELFYVATCNRVLYCYYDPKPQSADVAWEVLSTLRPDVPFSLRETIADQMQLLYGADAVRHLLEVAASMDSLVVGEREILRQLREAYDYCRTIGLTGDHLRLLLRFTVETAKEVYTSTGIGEKALSVVALAFSGFQRRQLPLDARILMVGAGQTNALFAKFLFKAGYKHVTVFNRTFERAQALAQSHGWRALPWDALPYYSEGFDGLVVCTGATTPVVDAALYASLLQGEMGAKTVVDLSIPQNVAPTVGQQFPIHYIEVESLREAARENLAHRQRECVKAAEIIEARMLQFRHLWHERQVERALAHIPDEVRAVKERAIQEVFAKDWANLDGDTQALVQRMMDYMEKKCVAIPIKAAKAVAQKMAQRHQRIER